MVYNNGYLIGDTPYTIGGITHVLGGASTHKLVTGMTSSKNLDIDDHE
jgi:hypothetical protein